MLNLNYNLIGAAGKQNRDINGFAAYPRYDEFSSSLALAIPGAVFYQDYQPLFGATTALDDISGYIKEGTTAWNLITLGVTGSGLLTGSILIAPQFDVAGYSNSIQAIGNVSALFQNTGSYQRLNLTTGSGVPEPTFGTNKGWVWEAWIAYPISESITQPLTRQAAIQPYPDSGAAVGSWTWNPAWSGDTTPLNIGGLVSGSSRFVKQNIAGIDSETIFYPYTSSLKITPYQFKHYAVSYSNPWYIGGETELNSSGVIRQYVNGQIVASGSVTQQFLNVTTPIQVFGYVGPDGFGNPWDNGVDAWFQDLRFYSGSNKNYTGSVIPVPEPMIVGRPY
jgi:hypothetical protein